LIILPFLNAHPETQLGYEKNTRWFIYFGLIQTQIELNEATAAIEIIIESYPYYRIVPYYNADVPPTFFFNTVVSSADLSMLSGKIRAAFAPSYANFTATLAYAITFIFKTVVNTTFYQVVLCTNTISESFMIISVTHLDVPSDYDFGFYIDTNNQYNNFSLSTSGSNCGVPGQFIFQFNTLTSLLICRNHSQKLLLFKCYNYYFSL
jgi:hypothetical protein